METWVRWELNRALMKKYYLDNVSWPDKGLLITLRADNNEQVIEIFFNDSIDAFRYTNESFCFKIFENLTKQYGDDFYKNWSFFKVQNSEYLQWLSNKSHGWSDSFSFTHFCILGGDEIVDIVTNYEPEVKVVKK